MKTIARHSLKYILLFISALVIAGCSTVPKFDPDAPPPLRSFTPEEGIGYNLLDSDPLEGFNRGTYRFNARFDRYVFVPVVETYRFIVPDYGEDRISDFIDNLGEFSNFYNNLLQLKFKSTGITLGRVAVNTTVGILGFWDRATGWGMKQQKEDLGQTLGHYGVGEGPFIMVPIVGPSNARDGVGMIGDVVMVNQFGPAKWVDNNIMYWSVVGLTPLDRRKRVDFHYHETGSPFEYELIRMAYGMKRKFDVAK